MARSEPTLRGRIEVASSELTEGYPERMHNLELRGVKSAPEQRAPADIYGVAAPDVIAMHNLQAKFAGLAQTFDPTLLPAWQDAEERLGRLKFFAVESMPVTYDVDRGRHVFHGRAHVLVEIVCSDDPELNESMMIGASVTGKFRGAGDEARITEFKLDPIPS